MWCMDLENFLGEGFKEKLCVVGEEMIRVILLWYKFNKFGFFRFWFEYERGEIEMRLVKVSDWSMW